MRKRDGEPCQQLAMENGYCYLHSGKTPRGDQWHKPQWSADNSKLNRKLNDLQRAAVKQEKRVKRMAPAERAAHDEWKRTHAPGSAAERRRRRDERRQAAEMRERLSTGPASPSPEVQAFQVQIDELKAELLRRQIERGEGVFG